MDNILEALINTTNLEPAYLFHDDNGEIMVSILCLTFNQEKYIRDALDSFLGQRINFNIEILVHDDCSDDSTPAILREYASKYPTLIKPFFEEENQYSKAGDTIEIERKYVKLAKGKYVAICEGDDYWTDPHKLFLQVSALERNKKCYFSVHKVKVVDLKDSSKNYFLPRQSIKTGIIDSKKFIDLVNEDYPFQTSSYFVLKQLYQDLLETNPLFSQLIPTSDESMLYYFGSRGDVLYINRVMSCYRKYTELSWNAQLMASSSDKQNERRIRFAKGIMEFYQFTNGQYESCIERHNRLLINTYLSKNQLKSLFSSKSLKRTLKKQGIIRYYKLWIKSLLLREKNEKKN